MNAFHVTTFAQENIFRSGRLRQLPGAVECFGWRRFAIGAVRHGGARVGVGVKRDGFPGGFRLHGGAVPCRTIRHRLRRLLRRKICCKQVGDTFLEMSRGFGKGGRIDTNEVFLQMLYVHPVR